MRLKPWTLSLAMSTLRSEVRLAGRDNGVRSRGVRKTLDLSLLRASGGRPSVEGVGARGESLDVLYHIATAQGPHACHMPLWAHGAVT